MEQMLFKVFEKFESEYFEVSQSQLSLEHLGTLTFKGQNIGMKKFQLRPC